MFSIIILHGEAGYTRNQKDHFSPSLYAMAGMLRPDKINGQYMTAVAIYSYNPQVIDGRTDQPFELDENIDQEGQNCIFIHQHLRVNWFMMMDRLAQHWLLDFFHKFVIKD
jgi:hypothetical protein